MGYPGGKGGAGVSQWIINHMPPHRTYIEPFLGNGAVLRAKRPARYSLGIDADAAVVCGRWCGDEVPNLRLICGDAIPFLSSFRWSGDELVYCDPPYLLSTRSTQRPLYRHEFATADEHRQLLACLRSLPCPVLISGYASDLYAGELATWRVDTFQTICRSGRRTTEYLWMNFPPATALHDYRFLGRNFRERERIKRRIQRWVARLRRMKLHERYALLAALDEVRTTGVFEHIASADDVISRGQL